MIGKRDSGLDCVLIAPAIALSRYVAGGGELGNDPMGGTFGDSDLLADLPQQHTRVVGDTHEHPSVIGQEFPAGKGLLRHKTQD